jgi:hypothetical protein
MIKIAVPTSPYCRPITENAKTVCQKLGWELIVTSEDECAKLLLRNIVQLALVSPLGYGMGVGKVDYRIARGPCVVMTDFTNMVGIDFNSSGDAIQTIGATEPRGFLPVIASIVLREKFELPATEILEITPDSTKVDCVVKYSSANQPCTLDVSEEWHDMTDLPLPVAIWVSRVEADADLLPDAIKEMANSDIAEIEVVEELTIDSDQFPREGRISYTWTENVIEALDDVLKTLYYHQFVPEIPAVKILGVHE